MVLTATLSSCSPPRNSANAAALVNSKIAILDENELDELQSSFLDVSGSDRIAFAASSAQLDAKSRFQLERQALWLKANDNVAIRLRSEAARPKDVEDRRLALHRAEAVRSYLKNMGVEAEQIIGIHIEYGKSDTVSTLIDKFHFSKPDVRQGASGHVPVTPAR